MISLVQKKITFFKNKSDESKILVAFRFISLLITYCFYLLNNQEHELTRKIIIIGCLLISSSILSYLYPTYEESKRSIQLLILLETLGNTILLIPSGGIKSSFVWYSLNTILISTIFLSKKYGWINFFMYLLTYGIINNNFTDNNINYFEVFKEESNLLLSFIMIIIAMQILTILLKKIIEENKRQEEANNQLEKSNEMLMESLETIKGLYQSVNILTGQGNKEGIIKISFEHIKRITKTNTVFYFDITNNYNKLIYFDESCIFNSIKEYILNNLKQVLESEDPIELSISNNNLLLVHVGNNYATYGLLGMETKKNKESIIYKNNAYQLQFLSELISNAFERLSLEEVNERLIISEEQNRIANEIHDSVLQRLFSMSCGMFSLIKNLKKYSTNEISDELNEFRGIIDSTMKELRNKIYGLSWKKSGINSFTLDINTYIEDIKKFNQINIPFNIIGNIEILSTEHKKALYRIICEGIGNAVKHSKAKNIEVILNVNSECTNLSIIDDGIGFDLNKAMDNATKGIGIQNLHQLTEILFGELKIESENQKGTKIMVNLPNHKMKGEATI